MGCDLIGFIFIGPIRVKPDSKRIDWKALTEELRGELRAVERWETIRINDLASEARPFLRRLLDGLPVAAKTPGEVSALVNGLSPDCLRRAILKLAGEFVAVWNSDGGTHRRWMHRDFELGRRKLRSVTVACESWGDAPIEDPLWRLCEEVAYIEPIVVRVLGLVGLRGAKCYWSLIA